MTNITILKQAGATLLRFDDLTSPEHYLTDREVDVSRITLDETDGVHSVSYTNIHQEKASFTLTKAQYDDIKAEKEDGRTSRIAGEPHTPSLIPIASTDRILHGETPLNEIVSDIIASMNAMSETQIYTSYKLDGTTISGFAGDRSKAICKYDLSKGYRFEQVPFSANVEDARHLVSLHTAELGVITFLSANSGMIGAVEVAMDNGTNIAQTAHTSEDA